MPLSWDDGPSAARSKWGVHQMCNTRRDVATGPSRSVVPLWYRAVVATRKIWTAEELEKMSPNERDEIVRAGFETDLTNVSPDVVERTRRKIESHIAANEGSQSAKR